MTTEWATLEHIGKVVTIQDAAQDRERLIPVEMLLYWEVDWLVEGGKLSVYSRACTTTIVFPAGDHGQACADAISELFLAVNPPKEGRNE